MNIIDKFDNWRRKQRWNKQYKKGRWNNLKNPIEASRYNTIKNFRDYAFTLSTIPLQAS